MERRDLLLKAAKTGTAAAVVWVAPVVIAIQPAAARDLGSRPPKTPPRQIVAVEPPMGPPLPRDLPGTLPFTGNDELRGLELGAVAVAAGYALKRLGRHGQPDWSEE